MQSERTRQIVRRTPIPSSRPSLTSPRHPGPILIRQARIVTGKIAGPFPHTSPISHAETALEERKVTAHIAGPRDPFEIISRFSSWPRLVRVTAYSFQFRSLCRRGQFHPPRSNSAHRDKEPRTRRSGMRRSRINLASTPATRARPGYDSRSLKNRNHSEKDLTLSQRPLQDRDGVLRVGGRLSDAPILVSARLSSFSPHIL